MPFDNSQVHYNLSKPCHTECIDMVTSIVCSPVNFKPDNNEKRFATMVALILLLLCVCHLITLKIIITWESFITIGASIWSLFSMYLQMDFKSYFLKKLLHWVHWFGFSVTFILLLKKKITMMAVMVWVLACMCYLSFYQIIFAHTSHILKLQGYGLPLGIYIMIW